VIENKSWFPGEKRGWKLTAKGHRKFSGGTETFYSLFGMVAIWYQISPN